MSGTVHDFRRASSKPVSISFSSVEVFICPYVPCRCVAGFYTALACSAIFDQNARSEPNSWAAMTPPYTGRSIPVMKLELGPSRSEEHTSELQSLMRISYDVFGLKKKKYKTNQKI